MTKSDRFTRCENDAAFALVSQIGLAIANQAGEAVQFYAQPGDRDAATVAVLMAALEIVYKRTRQVDPNQWAFDRGLESF